MAQGDDTFAQGAPARRRSLGPAAFLLVAALVVFPLLLTPVLPLTDFYAHLVRYHILATVDALPALQRHYEAAWKLLPNLGLDIVATGLMKVFPPLLTGKILGALIMGLPAVAALCLARVLHGRIGAPAALLAGLLTVNHIVIWGFSNFLVGLSLAILGIALWLRLAERPALQLAVSAVVAVLILFVHGLTFALWGLMLGAVELAREIRLGRTAPLRLAVRMARLALLAVIPVFLFLQMPTAAATDGVTVALTNLQTHVAEGRGVAEVLDEIVQRLDGIVRVVEAGWPALDRPIGAALWLLIGAGMATGALRLHPDLRLAVAGVTALVLFMPPNMFGVGHIDERMPLVLLALLAAGLAAPAPGSRGARALVAGLAVLLVLRTAVLGVAWAESGARYERFRTALEALPAGGLGSAVFLDGTEHAGSVWPNCKPLVFLMHFDAGTFVPTFASPTQQPLAIKGPLGAARRNEVASRPAATGLADELARHAAAGFEHVVVCSRSAAGPAPEGTRLVATEPPWALYDLDPEADPRS